MQKEHNNLFKKNIVGASKRPKPVVKRKSFKKDIFFLFSGTKTIPKTKEIYYDNDRVLLHHELYEDISVSDFLQTIARVFVENGYKGPCTDFDK